MTEVEPKFVSRSDPTAQWTGALKGPAFFAYADNYLIDVQFGIIVCRSLTRGSPSRGWRGADHARQLAEATWQEDLEEMVRRVARDFDEIAEDIEAGATEVRHPSFRAKHSSRDRAPRKRLRSRWVVGLAHFIGRTLRLGAAHRVDNAQPSLH